jgi:hypothetical protein
MVLTSESKERVSLVSTVVREEILQLPYLLIVIQTSRDRSTICIHQSLSHLHRQHLVELSRSTPSKERLITPYHQEHRQIHV